ncbi:hypothetical protein MHU86_7987 [Fragilaria crotonensis]|nr:hypothetical protein MHU86_7987 [Fragilaria crotonensis]
MIRKRLYAHASALITLALVIRIDSLTTTTIRKAVGPLHKFRYASASNSEWQARNVYNDLDLLRQSIAKDQADDRLREIQRRQLLNSFAANRRPLFEDVRRFVLLPILSALLLTAVAPLNSNFSRIRRSLGMASRVEFWAIVVAAPIRLLWLANLCTPSPPTLQMHEEVLPPRRARGLYSTIVQLDPPESRSSRDTVLSLSEYWVSAVTGTAVLGIWFTFLQTAQTYSRLWPWIRFATRLGAIASLHQYPTLLYDLRNQVRPQNRFESSLLQLSNRMLQFSLVGLTSDLSEMMMLTSPRVVLSGLCLSLITLCDVRRTIASSDASTVQGVILGLITRILAFVPYMVSGWLLWHCVNKKVKVLQLWVLFPMIISSSVPLLHIVAALRLVRIKKTHNLSLASKDIKFVSDPKALQKVTKWRYRLNWRQPSMRLAKAIMTVVDDCMYKLFFEGGVPDKFLELSKRQFQRDTKDLEEKVQELDQVDPMDSSSWKQDAMENLAREHQQDYDNGSYKDPLGVAIQQTFGIGLGFAAGHMDPLPPDVDPSPRRLQARAAKSAILRLQDIYDIAIETDLDSIKDHKQRLAMKAEMRKREEAEKSYLARQMTELIPLVDDGDDDDPASKIFLPKRSIRKMYRAMLQGVSEYDESIDPPGSMPWTTNENNT